MSVSVSNKQYRNFGNCVFLDNGLISLGVTVDLGPRIIYFARRGKENVLFEDVERRFTEPAGEYGSWVAYGGHRIWIAPEVNPETYYPDNAPVSCSIEGNRLILTPPATPFGKEFTVIIEIDDAAPVVKLTHRIKNVSESETEFAPWSVTSLSDSGVCMIPVNTAKRGYLPNRVISLWDYSDIYDSRFRMSNSMVRIRQDPFIRKAFKAGFNLEDGFAVYAVKEQIFAKCISEYKDVCYPDFSCNFEVYTNNLFLECEFLGEKRKFAVGEEAVLCEKWCLLDNSNNAEPSDMMDDIGNRINELIN